VTVLFLKQNDYSRKKSTWNWATEWYTGHQVHAYMRTCCFLTAAQEVHCELFFAHTGQTCRVSSASPVEMVTGKAYRPQDWLAFEVHLSPGQLRASYDFCKSQVGKPFDRKARNLFCVSEIFCCGNVSLCSDGSTPSLSDGHPSAWICSRLSCCALKQAGLMQHLDEWSCTPGQLRELLQHWAEQSELPSTGLSRAIGQPRVRQISLSPPPSSSY